MIYTLASPEFWVCTPWHQRNQCGLFQSIGLPTPWISRFMYFKHHRVITNKSPALIFGVCIVGDTQWLLQLAQNHLQLNWLNCQNYCTTFLIICNTGEDIVYPLRSESLIQTEAVSIPKYLGEQHTHTKQTKEDKRM
jgi:hypothetical protein